MFHSSSNASEFKNDNKEASAAAKESEEFLDKDAEILRLIEERRSTPKEEKQRLKGLSKRIKNCIREKKRMKRQQDIPRILEEFKGVRNIPVIKTAKKKVLITKIKNDNGECITSRKTKDFTRTAREMTSNMKLVKTEEYLKLRQKSYKMQVANSKKANHQTAMEYVPKTSKLATTRREKW